MRGQEEEFEKILKRRMLYFKFYDGRTNYKIVYI
jgi:hypothetical protein